jgi:DNA uptake protein ComE-like DNA-binding protein
MRNLKAIGRRLRSLRSSALVIALLGITLVTVLTLTLFLISRYERKSANLALGKATSESLADLGADLAITRIQEATTNGMAVGKMWISEPGRIRVYNTTNLTEVVDYNLFSALPGADTTTRDENNVDLNKRSFDGKYPIANPAPGNTQATMKVGWINLPANPGAAPSTTNAIAGRIAYWVDDESCKVNINTADGSKKNTEESYGFGTPTEISLQALEDSSNVNLSQAQAAGIASFAWNNGFNSASEIGRVPGVPESFYETNKFNLTHYNKTPELTFYGEPRMYLLPAGSASNVTYTFLTGPYFPQITSVNQIANVSQMGERIDFVYPTSRQLPQAPAGIYDYRGDHTYLADNLLPQYASGRNGGPFNKPQSTANNRAINFVFAYRMAQAFSGRNSLNNTFQWPAFGNSGASPATKYNVRQRDSIALQILDISNNSVFADHARAFSIPSLSSGILDNAINPATRIELVTGIGRSPKLTEMIFSADVGVGNPLGTGSVPFVQPRITLEFYFPKYYQGVPLERAYGGKDIEQWRMGNRPLITKTYIDPVDSGTKTFTAASLNEQDIGTEGPKKLTASGTYFPGDPSPLDPNSYWANNMLRIPGADLAGNPAYTDFTVVEPSSSGTVPLPQPMANPSQSSSSMYHAPYAYTIRDNLKAYQGVYTSRTATRWLLLQVPGPSTTKGPVGAEQSQSWQPGTYHSQDHAGNGIVPYFATIGQSSFPISGGLAFRSHTAGGSIGNNWEFAPIDSMRGDDYTNEVPSAIKADLLKAVIPVNFDAPDTYIARVADPLVNKFPGDWIIDLGGANPTVAMPSAANYDAAIYVRGGYVADPNFPADISVTMFPIDKDGDNPEFTPARGGDPLSLWLPRQDTRYPKQSRFPSIGALNYVRTGMIPDDLSVPIDRQKGVPFRGINLTNSSTSQGVYPDWAMLDLFTVPAIPQPTYFVGQTATPKRKLTYGGATEGKLNINNPRIPFPFDRTLPGVTQTPPIRTAPLEALFYGIKTSNSYNGAEPVFNTVSRTDAQTLRQGVQDYLTTNGPFVLPGQLSRVPAIDNYSYRGVSAEAISRNDLMREVIGTTTTQSNVFSIWIVAQSIKKNLKNTNPNIFEPGDNITGETRRRYIIERHIDYGKDGVPGNANNPGPDGIVGTEDDPIDVNFHPLLTYPLPYKWRIVAVESYSS